MKTTTPLICLFLLTTIWGCGKDKAAPADFRDAYVGEYLVKENIWPYGSCHEDDPQPSIKDTIIEIGYGQTDTTLSVLGRDIWLDTAHYYSEYHYSLYLIPDSIFSSFLDGGLGCGFTIKHYGRKI